MNQITDKMIDDSPSSLEVEMGESVRMALARRLKQETKKGPDLSPLLSSENKDITTITRSVPSSALWSLGKNLANKTVKTFKDLLGCLGLDDEEDVVDPLRTIPKIADHHNPRSQSHQLSTSKGKDSFLFPVCPALPIDQSWSHNPTLVANKDSLWIIFYHFSDCNHKEQPYITVPKLQELLSICGLYPSLVSSVDLSTILAEDVGMEIRSDTNHLSFSVFVEVLWHIAERALIIIPEQPESTEQNNLRFEMLLHLMETYCGGKCPSFDLHILEEHRTKAAIRKRIEKPIIPPDPKDRYHSNSNRKKEKGRRFLEELASGICGSYDDSSDSS